MQEICQILTPLPGKVPFRLTLIYYQCLVNILLILLFLLFLILAELSSLYAKYTERKRTLVSLRSQIRLYTMQYESKLYINDDYPNWNIPATVDVHGKLLPNNQGENRQRGQNPTPRPQEYYKGDKTPLPQGHTFMVTSSQMQMLSARGLF